MPCLVRQCSHYVARGLFLALCHGSSASMDQFFAYHTHSLATVDGIKNCLAVLAASLVR
jgi:hypothetical protein